MQWQKHTYHRLLRQQAPGAEYDTNAKYLLADKQILARILKYTVKEFQDMPVEDIISSIGDDIEVGTRPLDPGLSNLGRVNVTAEKLFLGILPSRMTQT